jgi:hypothetical protein
MTTLPTVKVKKLVDIEIHMEPETAEAVRLTLHYALLRENGVIDVDDPRIGGDPEEIRKALNMLNELHPSHFI